MNAKKIVFWIATVLFAGFMLFSAYSYLTRDPKMMAAFASLGYPSYFPIILGVAKLLGAITLLLPGLPRLKEWAYAGFTFTLLGAFFSHLASGQSPQAAMPAIFLVVVAISYGLRPYRYLVTDPIVIVA